MTQQAQSVEPTGAFLSDYSKLAPGKEGEALQVYRNPRANFAAYDKVLLDPVTVWLGPDSSLKDLPQEDRQRLANDLYTKLKTALAPDYKFTDEPGPGVMRIRAAITEATERYVVLDTMSTVIPQMRVISGVKNLATGTQSFVGKASVEAEVKDTQTGEVLFAAIDRRAGGKTLEKGTSSWSDVDEAFQYWADRAAQRLRELRQGRS